MIWKGEGRRFFCVNGTSCVTMWKTFNNTCYIIPGKYLSLFPPSKNFIRCNNETEVSVSVYFSDKLTNSLIFNTIEDVEIHENGFSFLRFFDDKIKYGNILFKNGSKTDPDLKEGVDLINMNISDNYAYLISGTQ